MRHANPAARCFDTRCSRLHVACEYQQVVCPAQPPAKDDELVYDSKRMLGATYEDLSAQRDGSAVSDLERWTFKVERGGSNSSQPVVAGIGASST